MAFSARIKKPAGLDKPARVRRLKEKDMACLDPELRRVIRSGEDGSRVVEILQGANINVFEGFLGKHGFWLESARRIGGQIHTLLVRDLEVRAFPGPVECRWDLNTFPRLVDCSWF